MTDAEYIKEHGLRGFMKEALVQVLKDKPTQKVKQHFANTAQNLASAEGTTDCEYSNRNFMYQWDAYKHVADDALKGKFGDEVDLDKDGQVGGGNPAEAYLATFDRDGDGKISAGEVQFMQDGMAEQWVAMVDRMLNERAEKAGSTRQEMETAFVKKHIDAITALGYKLSPAAIECLEGQLKRFWMCDIGPAPFSVHTVEALHISDEHATVTVANHCLQVATHWLRNPPELFEVLELEEFIVLSLFHDVYYYDDFPNHDIRSIEALKPFLRYERPVALVGGHLQLGYDEEKVKTGKFDGPLDALRQEWVQMDWFLTMVAMKYPDKKVAANRPVDSIVLPLDFFHHILGRVMSGDELVIEKQESAEAHW